MGSVYNRGTRSKPNWYVSYKDRDGKRRAVASHQPSKARARRFLVEVEARIAAGKVGVLAPEEEPLCGPLLEKWAASLTNRAAYNDRGDVRRYLIPAFGDSRLSAVNLAAVMHWLDGMRARGHLADGTMRRVLGHLSRFFSWAIARGMTDTNPVRQIPAGKRPQASPKRNQPWLHDENLVRQILARLPEPANLMFYLGNRSGMRVGEIVSLRLSDFAYLDQGVIRVRFSHDGPLKEDKRCEGKSKWVPAADDCARFLGPWLDARRAVTNTPERHVFPQVRNAHRHYNPMTLHSQWDKVRQALGLEMTWHQATRHSFASRLSAAGVPLDEIADALGHSSPVITRRFYDHYIRRSYSHNLRGGLGLGVTIDAVPASTPSQPLQTIGLLGDIHSEDERLATALAHLRTSGVERILAVGDIVDGPGDFVRTCALLDAPDIEAVRGNHERWLFSGTMRDLADALPTAALGERQREFLAGLPVVREYATGGGPALLCHGLGLDDMAGLKPDDDVHDNLALQALRATACYRIVLAGHTHRRMVRHVGGLTVVNAGTLYRDHQPGFARIDFAAGEVAFFDLVERDGEIAVNPAARISLNRA